MPRIPKRPRKAAPAAEPNLLCPFTGKPLCVKTVRNGLYWMAEGPFYSTRLYDRKEELLFDLSTRGGVEPAFPRVTSISMREIEPPPDNPVQDQIERAKFAQSLVEEIAKET